MSESSVNRRKGRGKLAYRRGKKKRKERGVFKRFTNADFLRGKRKREEKKGESLASVPIFNDVII